MQNVIPWTFEQIPHTRSTSAITFVMFFRWASHSMPRKLKPTFSEAPVTRSPSHSTSILYGSSNAIWYGPNGMR